jgi:hypothetical protein
MPRAPFAWNCYRHRSLPVSAQRLINVFAETQPAGAKSQVILLPTPGLDFFAEAGTGPIRGMLEMAGALYVVSEVAVYRVSAEGIATYLGEIEGGGPVSMAENGAQVLIVVPDSGKGYIVTSTSVTLITDEDFPAASSCTYIDGYFVVSEANAGAFHLSALDDGLTWNGDVAEAERSPDNLVRAVRVGSVLWLFGEFTTEIWSNQGAADFPFLQVSGAFVERGCAARDSVDHRLGTVFWLGDDRVIYRSDNFQPQRISNHAIEQEIGGYATVSDAIGSIYEQEGHTFYVLTFPSEGNTWVYDAKEGMWHERESEGYGTWRCAHVINYAGAALGADTEDGRIYRINPTLSTEDGDKVIRVATGIAWHSENKRVFFSRFSAEFERGASSYASGDSANIDGDVFLTSSNDGGRTWSAERWRKLGFQGQYRGRVEWRRNGSAREKVFRLQWSDPVRTALIAVNVDAESGQH